MNKDLSKHVYKKIHIGLMKSLFQEKQIEKVLKLKNSNSSIDEILAPLKY
jgi:hypothetical protein